MGALSRSQRVHNYPTQPRQPCQNRAGFAWLAFPGRAARSWPLVLRPLALRPLVRGGGFKIEDCPVSGLRCRFVEWNRCTNIPG